MGKSLCEVLTAFFLMQAKNMWLEICMNIAERNFLNKVPVFSKAWIKVLNTNPIDLYLNYCKGLHLFIQQLKWGFLGLFIHAPQHISFLKIIKLKPNKLSFWTCVYGDTGCHCMFLRLKEDFLKINYSYGF